jgi:glycosyltransferase involved in cell wall biosynthesis
MKRGGVGDPVSPRSGPATLKSLSIIVPAYNEGENIVPALEEIVAACEAAKLTFEILVVNDCSTDDTGQKAKIYSQNRKEVQVIDNPVNLGFGGAFRTGLARAAMDSSVMVCGDNCIDRYELGGILRRTGEADIVVPYIANPEVRSLPRRWVSRLYVFILNVLFGLNLKYYNGHNVFPTKAAQVTTFGPGFAFSAEILIRMLSRGYTCVQVPMVIRPRLRGKTKAFAIRNIARVVSTIVRLYYEIRISRRIGGRAGRVERGAQVK